MRKYIVKYVVALIFTGMCIACYSQEVYWDCLKRAGGIGRDEAYSVATDQDDNIIVTGFINGTAEFDGAEASSTGGADIFIAKYDDNMDIVWLKTAGGNGEDKGHAVITDEFGNIYVTGFFSDTAYFEDTQVISGQGIDMFIAKYDNNGDLSWVYSASSDSGSCGNGITNYEDRLYIAGYFYGTMNFGDTSLTSYGDADVFFAAYDIAGDHYWSEQAGGINWDEAHDITVDSDGRVFATGNYREYALFGDSVIPANEICNIFTVCYNDQGEMLWVKYAGGQGSDRGYGICTDGSDNVYITGYICLLSDSAYFDTTLIVTNGGRDMYLAKYNNAGDFQWVTKTGSAEEDIAKSVVAVDEDNIFITGYFNDTLFFGDTNIISGGYNDVLVAAFNTEGLVKWVKKAGSGLSDSGESITKNKNNVLKVTGFFRETAYTDNDSVISSGNADILILSLTDTNIVYIEPVKQSAVSILVYPNPARGVFNIDISGTDKTVNIEIFDIYGRLMLKNEYNDHQNYIKDSFDFSGYSRGIYFIRIISADLIISRVIKIAIH